MSRIVKIAIALGILTGVASADALTGIELQTACNVQAPDCIAFVMGMTQGVRYGQAYSQQGYKICVPDDATAGQLEQVVQKYLREHPEKLHESAGSLSAEAIYAAFPCRNSN